MKPDILYEDRHLLVLYKPAGVAVQSARVGAQDCESILKNYLYQKEQTSGSSKAAGGGVPSLHLVHRLDQPVEGLLVFALDKKTAAVLSRQVSQGGMEKSYLAVRRKTVEAKVENPVGEVDNLRNPVDNLNGPVDNWTEIVDYLWKDTKANRSVVVAPSHPGAKKAVLSYRVLVAAEARELVEIRLVTGRHHQIRVQMAAMGTPIVGDMKYGTGSCAGSGAESGGYAFPALCAYRLLFTHPATGKKMEFQIAPRNPAFKEFEAYMMSM